ncbi:chemotaxis protein CheD [Leptospira jelokensis]|uniref:Probable chemoreceptor glutamine deamidase CheD n=2 Tax=Leptospira jelokensis TaxID=2484931 RepID=A0A4Z0ZSI6_9LEPT|nr:chemotaxis protein CheD [Leptospira jelokensis]
MMSTFPNNIKSNLKPVVYLNIGETFFSNGYHEIRTILGSCVSVCLFHEQTKFSAINHILLPKVSDFKEEQKSLRYGENSMEHLISYFVKQNIPRYQLKAKIFGGTQSPLLPNFQAGTKNIQFVTDFLTYEKIPIASRDTGGELYRKLSFHTDSFDVFITKLQPQAISEILIQEKHFETKVKERMLKKTSIFNFNQ